MSLGKKVLTSSSFLIGIKIIHRLIGLISILILARLLTPEDFGIVALTAMVVYFFDILAEAGSEQYIIQKDHVDTDDLNTAWTIDIIIKSGLWLILMISSPFAADFFEQPQLEQALYVGSIILIINAAKNPGLFLLKQNFDYNAIFKLSVVQKLASFAVAIIIAFQYRSFWALIIADIVASLTFTIGSYLIHKHRPQLSLLKIKEQWHFSQWLLFKGVVGYTRSQIDTLLVSKFFPAAQLGHYYMARDIAMMPSHNLLQPAVEPLLAAFKTARNDKDKLQTQVNYSLLAISLFAIPIGIYIWYFPAPIIGTLLGDQWTGANEVLGVMALLFLYFSFIQVFEQLLIAMQKVKALFLYDLFSLIFIFIVLYSLISDQLAEFALLRGVLGVITTLAIFIYLRSFVRIGNSRLLVMMGLLAAIGIALANLIQLIPIPLSEWPVVELVITGSLFVGSYLLLFYLASRFLQIKEIEKIKEILIKKS